MVNSIIQTAVSGLLAQSRAVGNAAGNIANSRTVGPIPEAGEAPPFQPIDTEFSSTSGGVQALNVARDPAFSTVFLPDSADANAEGLIAAPNVSLEEELINTQVAALSYKANAAVLRTAADIADETLEILS